jgi:hypothetical protein
VVPELDDEFAKDLGDFASRRLPPFSWTNAPSPHVAADYVLLLGVLLAAADLAWIESQFRLLGPNWAYHLLVVALLYLAAAYRFDSRAVLSLALSTFAAWRGVAVSLDFALRGAGDAGRPRERPACGVLFIGAGILSVRANRKAHFEPVWTTLGLLLFSARSSPVCFSTPDGTGSAGRSRSGSVRPS